MQAVLLLLVLLVFVIALTIVPAYAVLYVLDHRKAARSASGRGAN